MTNLKIPQGMLRPHAGIWQSRNSTSTPTKFRCRSISSAVATSLLILLVSNFFVCVRAEDASANAWRTTLSKELPLLGHRNWIVVVDSAYPLQVSPGVETVETGASQEEVVRAVLDELAQAKHVAPDVYMDAELPFVPEEGAPGVTRYREQIHGLLGSLPVHSLPHEQIINTLDEAGKTFHILVLKTTLTVPYTSVFIRLDCRYWGPAAEQELRKAMKQNGAGTNKAP